MGPKTPPDEIERRKEIFLAELSRRGIVSDACDAAGVDRRTMYKHRETDPVFAERWAMAIEDAADNLEKEAWRRAVSGVPRPVFGRLPGPNAGAGVIGEITEYSDRLLQFLLVANNRAKFGDKHEIEHTGGLNITTFVTSLSKVYGDES